MPEKTLSKERFLDGKTRDLVIPGSERVGRVTTLSYRPNLAVGHHEKERQAKARSAKCGQFSNSYAVVMGPSITIGYPITKCPLRPNFRVTDANHVA